MKLDVVLVLGIRKEKTVAGTPDTPVSKLKIAVYTADYLDVARVNAEDIWKHIESGKQFLPNEFLFIDSIPPGISELKKRIEEAFDSIREKGCKIVAILDACYISESKLVLKSAASVPEWLTILAKEKARRDIRKGRPEAPYLNMAEMSAAR